MERIALISVKWIAIAALLLLNGCNLMNNPKRFAGHSDSDLSGIVNEQVLVAVTEFNSTNYFIYKGEPMGFQFDMLQAYADHLGVRLEIIVENNLDEAFGMLQSGEVDLIANNLTVTSNRNTKVDFTHPIARTRQVLVQRKSTYADDDIGFVSSALDLSKGIVYIQKGSAALQRMENLSDEIGAPISVVEMDMEVDELIELVSNGEIDFIVCDEKVARVNAYYYRNLDVSVPVSLEQNLAWAVSKSSPELLTDINEWLATFSQTAEYRIIHSKYFENAYWARRIIGELTKIRKGNISIFDEHFRIASQSIDWDWRLFASLVYQESRFVHNVKSHMGAYGLMQFMPATADFFGVKHKAGPEVQIEAGAKYLRWLEKRFENTDIAPEERVKFILASYNAGLGHVIDARNLARKYGKNPDVWEGNVDYFILNKSRPEYYRDSVVQFGYARGHETYNYVNQVMARYKHYQNILPD